jgi:hypothetical protein
MDDEEVGAITVDAIPALMLAACPSFESAWAESVEFNRDDGSPSGRLNYVDAGDFIRHLVALKLRDDTHEFPAVFDLIEALVLSDDKYIRDLGVIGYVEGLQMMTVTSAGLDPERDFRPYLRPASELAWRNVNEFWDRMSNEPM